MFLTSRVVLPPNPNDAWCWNLSLKISFKHFCNDGWFHHPYKVGPGSSYKWSYNPPDPWLKTNGVIGGWLYRAHPTNKALPNSRTLRFSSADLIGCTALWSLLHSFCFEVNLWEKRRRRFGCTKIHRFPQTKMEGERVLGSFFSDVKTEVLKSGWFSAPIFWYFSGGEF